MKKNILVVLGIVSVSAPFSVFAVTAESILIKVSQLLNIIIPILITLAVVYFIWGVIQYTITTDEETKKKAREKVIYGLIGLFVIISFWGIVKILKDTFGINPVQIQRSELPCIPNAGQYNC